MWDRDYELARMQIREREKDARLRQMLRASQAGRPSPAARLIAAIQAVLGARGAGYPRETLEQGAVVACEEGLVHRPWRHPAP